MAMTQRNMYKHFGLRILPWNAGPNAANTTITVDTGKFAPSNYEMTYEPVEVINKQWP